MTMLKPMRPESARLAHEPLEAGAAAAQVTMFDSAADDFPLTGTGAGQFLLCYNDGAFANVAEARTTWPNVTIVPISVLGTPRTRLYDCEPNCVWPPARAVELVVADVQAGLQSNIYGSLSTLTGNPGGPNVATLLQSAGLTWGTGPHDVGFFLADPDGNASVPVGFWAKQYLWGTNTPPGAWDTSVALTTWPMLPQPDPPSIGVDMPQYVRYPTVGGKYPHGLIAECSGGVATNMAGNWPNVVAANGGVEPAVIEDPNGTLLDSYPVHHGF